MNKQHAGCEGIFERYSNINLTDDVYLEYTRNSKYEEHENNKPNKMGKKNI